MAALLELALTKSFMLEEVSTAVGKDLWKIQEALKMSKFQVMAICMVLEQTISKSFSILASLYSVLYTVKSHTDENLPLYPNRFLTIKAFYGHFFILTILIGTSDFAKT